MQRARQIAAPSRFDPPRLSRCEESPRIAKFDGFYANSGPATTSPLPTTGALRCPPRCQVLNRLFNSRQATRFLRCSAGSAREPAAQSGCPSEINPRVKRTFRAFGVAREEGEPRPELPMVRHRVSGILPRHIAGFCHSGLVPKNVALADPAGGMAPTRAPCPGAGGRWDLEVTDAYPASLG